MIGLYKYETIKKQRKAILFNKKTFKNLYFDFYKALNMF